MATPLSRTDFMKNQMDWTRQQQSGEDYGYTDKSLGASSYEDYLRRFNAQNAPAGPAPINPANVVPGANQVPGVNPSTAPTYQTTPDFFTDMQGAGIYGVNQASGIYSMGSPSKTSSQMTNDSYSMANNLANNNWGSAAMGTINGVRTSGNPYQSQFSQLSRANNPVNFNSFTGSQNPYGSQIGNSYQANPYQSNLTSTGNNPYMSLAGSFSQNPFMSGFSANPSEFNYSQNRTPFDFDTNYNNQFGSQVGNSYQSNPYSFETDYSNPYTSQIGNGFQSNQVAQNLNFDQSNPFLQGFQDFGNMQNSYLDATVDKALGKVSDKVNSQFGLAGRTGSGAHQQLMTESLGDVANQMYSDNFQQNANRSLQALQSGSSAYDSLQGRNLQSLGMGIDAFNADQNRNLDYLNSAAGLDNQSFSNRLAATQAGASTFDQDQSRKLDTLNSAAGIDSDSFNNRLAATQAGANAFQSDEGRAFDSAVTGAQFGNEGQRMLLDANQLRTDAFNADQARRLQGIGLAGDIYNADADRRLQGYGMATDSFNTDQDRRLDSLINAGNFRNTDLDRQFAATGANADLWQQGFDNRYSALNAASGLYQDDIANRLTAAGMLPDIQGAQWNDVLMMNTLGGQQDDQNFYNQNKFWNNLNNYANVIATMNGTQPMPDNSVSGLDRLLGIGGTLGAAAIMKYSDRRVKENIKPMGKENGFDVYEFNYIGRPQKYIGVMADEVEQIMPEAVHKNPLGYRSVNYDMIGVEMRAA